MQPSARTVVNCYEVLDAAIATAGGGVWDFTEGLYHGNPATPYAVAQRYQLEHLLDLAHCGPGCRLLDIGCGYGTLLEAARARGAQAVGITISPAEVRHCQGRGLDVRLCDYRQLPERPLERFDCLVANGSAEHFVQVEDALAGRADEIYREFFALAYRVLEPVSPNGRLVTTIIHFDRFVADPRQVRQSPFRLRIGSDSFHYAMLIHSFGGFYPQPGQLKRCADPWFHLEQEEDGTEDYLFTSEDWLRILKRSFLVRPSFLVRLGTKIARYPRHGLLMLACLLLFQSWNWQFRGPHPPMRLLRQVWRRAD